MERFVHGAIANELRMLKYGQVRVDGIHPQAPNPIGLLCCDPVPSVGLFHRDHFRAEACASNPS